MTSSLTVAVVVDVRVTRASRSTAREAMTGGALAVQVLQCTVDGSGHGRAKMLCIGHLSLGSCPHSHVDVHTPLQQFSLSPLFVSESCVLPSSPSSPLPCPTCQSGTAQSRSVTSSSPASLSMFCPATYPSPRPLFKSSTRSSMRSLQMGKSLVSFKGDYYPTIYVINS